MALSINSLAHASRSKMAQPNTCIAKFLQQCTPFLSILIYYQIFGWTPLLLQFTLSIGYPLQTLKINLHIKYCIKDTLTSLSKPFDAYVFLVFHIKLKTNLLLDQLHAPFLNIPHILKAINGLTSPQKKLSFHVMYSLMNYIFCSKIPPRSKPLHSLHIQLLSIYL